MKSLLVILALLVAGLTGCMPAARAYRDRQAGDRAYVKRDYREAYLHYASAVRASAGLVNVEGPENEALTYYNLGLSLEKLGNYELEREVMARARDEARATKDRSTELLAAKSLAESAGFRGEYQASIRDLEALLPEAEKALPKVIRAAIHRSLAVAQGALGEFEKQKAEAETARAISAGAGDKDGEAGAEILLAYYHAARAEYAEGMASLAKAEALLKSSKEPDLAQLDFARGTLLRSQGQYREALAVDLDALRLAKASHVEEAEAVADSRLGLDYFVTGDLERARTRFQLALGIDRALGARDDEAEQGYYLGKVAAARRNWSESIRRLSEARSLYASLGQELGRAVVELALGEVYRENGEPRAAMTALDAAGKVFAATGEVNGKAEVAVETAMTQLALSEYADALASAVQAAGASDPDLRWRALFAKGLALGGLRRTGESLAAYREAIEELERMRQHLRLASLQSGFAASRRKLALYQETVKAMVAAGKPDEAFDYAERARARAFLDQMGNRSVKLGSVAEPKLLEEERQLSARLAALTEKLQAGYSSPQAGQMGAALERIASEIESLRAERQEKVDEIALKDPKVADLVGVKPLTLREVQARIPAGTSVLEYFIAGDRLLTWVVRRSSSRLAVTSVPQDDLVGQANLFRVALEQNLPMADEVGRKLYGWLVAPVERDLSTSAVWVVPHLALHYVPFGALVGPDGKYLVERHVFANLPSASFLKLEDPKAPAAPLTLLAAGNPTLETTADDLPFAEKEVESIQGLFRSRVLLRDQATQAAFLKALAEPPPADLIHLACHAELDPLNPLFSAILLGKGGGLDGEMTVQEVYGLTLSASVVMLSACNTAMGPVSQGDELVGLMRAFKQAGARAVVASLWEVDDEATAKLAATFYSGLKSGKRASALRDAQLRLLEAKFGPHFWAAFVWQGT